MKEVKIEVDGTTHTTQLTEDTARCLQDGADLRNHPYAYYLFLVVKEYGALTEENVVKFMDEKWVL